MEVQRGPGAICESGREAGGRRPCEWIEFVRVEAVPRPGEIVAASETWGEPRWRRRRGGRATAWPARRRSSASSARTSSAAVPGRSSRRPLSTFAATTDDGQRRGFCYVDESGERTITVIGDKGGRAGVRAPSVGRIRVPTASTSRPGTPKRRARPAGPACSSRPRVSCRRCGRPASSSTPSSRAGRTRPSATRRAISTRPRSSSSPPLARSAAGPSPAAPTRRPRPTRRMRTPTARATVSGGAHVRLAQGMPVADALAFASERGALALTRRARARLPTP